MYEYTEYKGKQILVLKRGEDDSYPFSFGKAKAKLIVEHFEVIKKFAAEDEENQKKQLQKEESRITGRRKKQSTLSQQD